MFNINAKNKMYENNSRVCRIEAFGLPQSQKVVFEKR